MAPGDETERQADGDAGEPAADDRRSEMPSAVADAQGTTADQAEVSPD